MKHVMVVRGIKLTRVNAPSKEFWGQWKGPRGLCIYESLKGVKRKWIMDDPMAGGLAMITAETVEGLLERAFQIVENDALKKISFAKKKYGCP